MVNGDRRLAKTNATDNNNNNNRVGGKTVPGGQNHPVVKS